MKRAELIQEIKNAIEDILIYENQRNISSLAVRLPESYAEYGITKEDLMGVPVAYTHLDRSKGFRILEKTSGGYRVRR